MGSWQLRAGPAADRRRFLDRLVTTLIPDHSASVAAFEKSMRHRNRLLEDDQDPRWVAAVEVEMAAEAGAVHFARADSLAHLQHLIDESLGDDNFPAARLALTPLRGSILKWPPEAGISKVRMIRSKPGSPSISPSASLDSINASV